jgi:hypothetical protein
MTWEREWFSIQIHTTCVYTPPPACGRLVDVESDEEGLSASTDVVLTRT